MSDMQLDEVMVGGACGGDAEKPHEYAGAAAGLKGSRRRRFRRLRLHPDRRRHDQVPVRRGTGV